jgi:hypothetical protein
MAWLTAWQTDAADPLVAPAPMADIDDNAIWHSGAQLI